MNREANSLFGNVYAYNANKPHKHALVIDVINRDGRSICSNTGKNKKNDDVGRSGSCFKRNPNVARDSPGGECFAKPHFSLTLYQTGKLHRSEQSDEKSQHSIFDALALSHSISQRTQTIWFFRSICRACDMNTDHTSPCVPTWAGHVMAYQRAFIIITGNTFSSMK